jgi:hypothetical protein
MRISLLVVVALVVTPFAGAFAREVIAIDSQGNVERFDTANPGRHLLLPPVGHTGKAGVAFNISYYDVTHHTGHGFDDPVYGAQWQAVVTDVLQYVASTLSGYSAALDVQFDQSFTGSGALASATTYFWAEPGWTNGFAFEHITTGQDPDAGQEGQVADLIVRVRYGVDWYLGTGTPGPSQYDFRSVLLHEFTHPLGFNSLMQVNGGVVSSSIKQEGVPLDAFTTFDKYLKNGNGLNLINSSVHFAGTLSDVLGQNNGVLFAGPVTTGIYGAAVPVYAPSTWADGSSISHWNTTVPGDLVMKHVLYNGQVRRQYAPIELGLLKDIGYDKILLPEGFEWVTQPRGGWFEVNQPLHLSVSFTGAIGEVSYQWTWEGEDIDGETESTLDIPSLALDDAGAYRCVVTDGAGQHISDAAQVDVFEQGSLPAATLAAMILTCILCVAFACRRFKTTR